MFNAMLLEKKYPNNLKLQKITPIFKQADRNDKCNYRPISCLPTLDKIFENLLYKQISNMVDTKNLLYKHQYGFRRGVGTQNALIDLVDMICNKLSEKQMVGAIFLDLKKAFDTIDHNILLNKLNIFGVGPNSLDLLADFLNNRRQYVVVDSSKSEIKVNNIGVPQGSILGPLLFLMYINDISCLPIRGKLIMFADDCSLFYPDSNISSIKQSIGHDLVILENYFKNNKLILNMSKTQLMCFKSERSNAANLEVQFNGSVINEVSTLTFLGVEFDSH